MLVVNAPSTRYTIKNIPSNPSLDSNEQLDQEDPDDNYYIKREIGTYGFPLDNYAVPQTVQQYISIQDNYEHCPNCQRKFFIGRLKSHLKSCKEGKPLKMKKNIEYSPENNSMSRKYQGSNSGNNNGSISVQHSKNIQVREMEEVETKQNTRPLEVQQNPDYSPENGNICMSANNNEYGIDGKQVEESQQFIEQTNNEDNNTVSCSLCSRKFYKDRIEKHEKICAKSQKKRPVFDMKKMRITEEQKNLIIKHGDFNDSNNTYEIQFIKQNLSKVKVTEPKKNHQSIESNENIKKPNMLNKEFINSKKIQYGELNQQSSPRNDKQIPKWKLEHENFIKNIKFNKKLKSMEVRGEDTSHMKPPETFHPDYVDCPYCFRKFAPKTAEVHIPKCKNIFNRPKPPKHTLDELNHINEKGGFNLKVLQATSLKKIFSNSNSSGSLAQQQQVLNIEEVPLEEENSAYVSMKVLGTKSANIHKRSRTKLKPLHSNPENSPQNKNKNNKLRKSGVAYQNLKGLLDNSPQNSSSYSKQTKPQLHESQNEKKFQSINQRMSPVIAGETKVINTVDERDTSPDLTYNPKFLANPQECNFISSKQSLQPLAYEDLITRSSNYSTVICQYCNRKFSKNASERHIPICKDLKFRAILKPPFKQISNDTSTGLTPFENSKLQHTSNKFLFGLQENNKFSPAPELARLVTTQLTRSSTEKNLGQGKLMRINIGKHIAIKNLNAVAENTDPLRNQEEIAINEGNLNSNSKIGFRSSKEILDKQINQEKRQVSTRERYKIHTRSVQQRDFMTTGEAKIFCTQCGGKVEKHHKFCGFCGSRRS